MSSRPTVRTDGRPRWCARPTCPRSVVQRERKFVVPAIETARTSFAGFEERPESDYRCAAGLTPEEAWARVAEELGRVAALVTLEGNEDRPLGLADIELIHRGIFQPVFGEQTLDFRAKATDRVEFLEAAGHARPAPASLWGCPCASALPSRSGACPCASPYGNPLCTAAASSAASLPVPASRAGSGCDRRHRRSSSSRSWRRLPRFPRG